MPLFAQYPAGTEASVVRTFHPGVLGRRTAETVANGIDLGDAYTTPVGRRSFRRLAGAWAVRHGPAGLSSLDSITNATGPLKNYARAFEISPDITLLKAAPAGIVGLRSAQESHRSEAAALRAANVDARPVLLDDNSHLMMVPTGEIIVRVKEGANAVKVLGDEISQQIKASPSMQEFILARSDRATEELFLEVDKLSRNPEVEWAEPNFLSEVIKHSVPNDTLINAQWHLHNTGQGGGVAGADGNVFAAWDFTIGSTNVVIAIIDDGVQISHPDLAANIFTNRAEKANGLDDDGNGFTNDLTGWNFANNSAQVGPIDLNNADGYADFHGTAVAGVAGAVGNNNRSVAGVAYGCKILPIKVITGFSFVTSVTMARAIRYAAGLNAAGVTNWRGADILSMSLGFGQSSEVDAALKDAAAKGRGGKGCPIFVATGNGASGWYQYAVNVTAASHTFKWVYRKDTSIAVGEDSVWLDEVVFPGTSTPERFEGATFPPAGWQTVAGTFPWTVDTSLNHAFGTGVKSARSGIIGDSASTGLQTTRTTTAGTFTFWMWVSSELDYDLLTFSLDGVAKYFESGDPIVDSVVNYPAGNTNCIAVGALTDFDFRSDYSQYASSNNWNGVDFLAPSDGGAKGIVTTDLVGTNGFNRTAGTAGDSTTAFGGTSSAAPFAAGVGALVLSMNTNLTAREVRSIMRSTCDKIGGVDYTNGTNMFYGYGRLNAYAAVHSQINSTPSLSAFSNQTIHPGELLTLTAFASDTNIPAQTLTFDLLPNIPPGAMINSSSGDFTWRPNAYQADSTNTIHFRVTDNGIPPLSATQNLLVTVTKLVPIHFGTLQVVAGNFRFNSATDPGITYTLQVSSSLTNWVNLMSTNAAGGFVEFVTPVLSGSTSQFYRVIIGP